MKIIGKGVFKNIQQEIFLNKPIKVNELEKFLSLPRDLENNLIIVRQNKKLNDDDLIYQDDKVILFFTPMGG